MPQHETAYSYGKAVIAYISKEASYERLYDQVSSASIEYPCFPEIIKDIYGYGPVHYQQVVWLNYLHIVRRLRHCVGQILRGEIKL